MSTTHAYFEGPERWWQRHSACTTLGIWIDGRGTETIHVPVSSSSTSPIKPTAITAAPDSPSRVILLMRPNDITVTKLYEA